MALKRQETILKESYLCDPKKVQKGRLEYYFTQNPNLPRRILFIYDGDILKEQRNTFLQVYKELAPSYPTMPEIIFLEVLKSHKVRAYLDNGDSIRDFPFGVLGLLSNREFLLINHQWPRDTLLVPVFYRFRLRLSKDIPDHISTEIPRDELTRIGLQLFQPSIFNTGKGGRPLRLTKVIHESHKLSREFAEKPDSMGVLWYKE